MSLHKRTLAAIVGVYVGVILMVLWGLVNLQVHRQGWLRVDDLAMVVAPDGQLELHLEGSGLTAGVSAVVMPEEEGVKRQFTLDSQFASGLWSDGKSLLVNGGEGLLLSMRLDEQRTMQVLGSVSLPGQITALTKVGHRVLIALARQGLWLVDLSNPAAPVMMGRLPGPKLKKNFSKEIVVDGTRAYAVDREAGLLMIDLADPNPRIAAFPTSDDPWRVTLYGKRLVTGSLDGQVVMYELAADGTPHPVGHLKLSDKITGVGMARTAMHVVGVDGRLYSYDVTSWPFPQLRSVVSLKTKCSGLKVLPGQDRLLVFGTNYGLIPVEVRDLRQPVVKTVFPLDSTVVGLQVLWQDLVCLCRQSVSLFSLAEVFAERGNDRVQMFGYDPAVHVVGGRAYLLHPVKQTENGRSLEAGRPLLEPVPDPPEKASSPPMAGGIDQSLLLQTCAAITERRQPEQIDLFCTEAADAVPQWQTTLQMPSPSVALWQAQRLYTASTKAEAFSGTGEETGVFRVYDVRQPQTPILRSELVLSGIFRSMAWLAPHFVVVAAGPAGLYVVDVADPDRPVLTGHLTLGTHLRRISQVIDVLMSGKQAYLAHQRNGLSRVDLSDPAAPRISEVVDVPGFARRMFLQQGFLFASLYWNGVFLVDVGTGEDWRPVGRLKMPFSVTDVAACRNRLFVSGGDAGLLTLPLPKRLPVRPLGRRHARVPLPGDLEPGSYRLFLYNARENLQVGSAFRIGS